MRKPKWQQEIAKERVLILFNLAEKEFNKYPERSRRYIELARKIGLRYNVRLPRELKKKFCKKCNSLLNFSSKIIRLNSKTKTINIKCLNCGAIYRHPYKKRPTKNKI